MTGNSNLHKAKAAKNDEFYTQISDIEKELKHYHKFFRGKIVFCNCDDPESSDFWKYFALNFDTLGLKKLIATHYETDKPSYKLELTKEGETKTTLQQNGDFRSPECITLLQEADIVITNPPFSLFREYVAQLMEYDKKFIIIGNNNAIICKEIFQFIKSNRMWLGHTSPGNFVQPDGTTKTFGNVCWFSNLETSKRHENLKLGKHYNPEDYPKYDNYDAINVDKVVDIPDDYYGAMGVPITFLDKYNPEQFEIVGATNNKHINCISFTSYINGRKTYARLLIKNKRTNK